ncbi:flagellar basal-body MS-ring/collar protein FliF [Maritalea myrionectae]|uniref:flagellar basal-body MS-ring/collar protein FliF n=2 Tax=Maritalea myrionectae TaxID=454601 RepID=UPI0009FC2028
MNSFSAIMARMGLARVAAMAVTAVLMIGFFAFLIFRVSTPQMAPVYTGLSFDDSAAITKELRAMGIPFEIKGDGEAISVPRDQITNIRMQLAESGLPSRGQVGYEIFDQQNTLGATSFVQNVNHLRALEGELARTISSLARVKSARVHLVLPERELFRREAKQPSASIALEVRGALSTGEIRSVQHLIASAVDGLSPNMVSIVDNSGKLLAAGTQGDEETMLTTAIEERTLAVETRLRNRLEGLLENVVGAGRARVQVSAELDMNRLTRTSESFDPNGQVVRSAQTRELANEAQGPANNGQVSVANELPGATQNAGENGGSSEQSSTTEETINYEISRVTETEIIEAGALKRLSVAVVVDGVYESTPEGNATYAPRSQEEINQIRDLVNSAIGFNADRGDQVEVVNMQFAERPELTFEPSESSIFDFTRDDLFAAVEMAVTLLIALALVFFVMRPLIKRVLEPEDQTPLLMAAAEAAAAEKANAQIEESSGGMGKKGAAKDEWLDEVQSLGQAQVQAIEKVGTLVEENPKQASMIIRNWLSQAA